MTGSRITFRVRVPTQVSYRVMAEDYLMEQHGVSIRLSGTGLLP